jgi:hypothetical protein
MPIKAQAPEKPWCLATSGGLDKPAARGHMPLCGEFGCADARRGVQ